MSRKFYKILPKPIQASVIIAFTSFENFTPLRAAILALRRSILEILSFIVISSKQCLSSM